MSTFPSSVGVPSSLGWGSFSSDRDLKLRTLVREVNMMDIV